MRQKWEYNGAVVEPEHSSDPILVAVGKVNKWLKDFWRVTFPDGSWIRCGSKDGCKAYIDACKNYPQYWIPKAG